MVIQLCDQCKGAGCNLCWDEEGQDDGPFAWEPDEDLNPKNPRGER